MRSERGKGQLISAVESNSSGVITSETLKYDVYGNLVEQDVYTASTGQTVTTRYAIDQNGNAWADLNSSNALEMRRLYLDGPNQVYARIAADGTLAGYFTDHLGSVRDIVDASGNALDSITYDAWGNITSESNASEGDREKWAGLVFDVTTGLYGTTNRFYDPMTGRWLEEDPTMFTAGDSNLYRYVGNIPTDWTDPTGLESSPTTLGERYDFVQAVGVFRTWKANDYYKIAKEQMEKNFSNVNDFHNDQADAFRHCLFSALLAKDPEFKPGYEVTAGLGLISYPYWTDAAHLIGYMHEEQGKNRKPPQSQWEYAMDMHNNNVGLEIGRKLGENASLDDVVAAAKKAVEDGTGVLQTLDNKG